MTGYYDPELATLGAKPSKCNTHIQVVLEGVKQGQKINLTLGTKTQEKEVESDEDRISFNFKYNGKEKLQTVRGLNAAKPSPAETYCPSQGDTLTGVYSIDGGEPKEIAVAIQGKKTKVTYEIATEEEAADPAFQAENNNDSGLNELNSEGIDLNQVEQKLEKEQVPSIEEETALLQAEEEENKKGSKKGSKK